MIKKLQKNLSILLVILFGAVFLDGLIILNWRNYQGNLRELKEDVRAEINDVRWNNFIESKGEDADLDYVEYCILYVDQDKQVTIYANHFESMTQERILQYEQQLAKHWKSGGNMVGVTAIFKRHRRLGKYIVLISGKQALWASMPVIIGSIVAAIIGIMLLFLIARMLSDWLVKPIDELVSSEKKFMSNASHELKTPLTVIRTNTELLAGEIGENKHLQYIEQETERMISLVNKMLTLTRLDAPLVEHRNQKFCLDEALFDVIYPMESVAYEKKLHMDVKIREGVHIVGDEEQIKSLMSILLDNAISYTPEGGMIQIEGNLRARKFYLRVTNNGEPIGEEEKAKLFERFFRKDEAREETGNHFGLGLSIAGSIVANHHGKITVESIGGKNTFEVVLPVTGK